MASLLRGVLARGGIRGRVQAGAAHHHQCQFLIARNFSDCNNGHANAKSDFFSQLEKDRKLIIFGREWKLSFNQVLSIKFRGSNLPPLKPKPDGSHSDPTKREIILSASSLIESVDQLIEDEPGCDILKGAMYMIYSDPRFQTYDEAAKMKVLSRVLDVIQYYPQARLARWKEVFLLRRTIKSFSIDDGKDILTEEQVVSRVIDVVQSYPVGVYKVKRKTHFVKHLQLDKEECCYIITALTMEFKMHLPDDIDSCERAIVYIYANQQRRRSLQEFRSGFWLTCSRPTEHFTLRAIELIKPFSDWMATWGMVGK